MASKIAGNIMATSLRFEWEIDNDTVRSKNREEYLESPKFTTNFDNSHIQWHMRLLPKGFVSNAQEEYLMFYLLYLDSHLRPREISFNIIDDKGEDIGNTNRVERLHRLLNIIHTGAECISRNFVENPANGILQNNILKFSFELKLGMQRAIGHPAINLQEVDDFLPSLEAIDKYEALLDDSKFSDVSLIVEGKSVKAHKCILAKSSSVFAAMFDAEMKEKQENTVEIDDIKYDVLVEMLRFVYVGKINNIDTLAVELAFAADKYGLDGLKKLCENTMTRRLDHDNVIDYLELADKLHMAKLKKESIELIVEKADDISQQPKFTLLPRNIVCEVFRIVAKEYR